MKKILLLFLFCSLNSGLFAAYQYGNYLSLSGTALKVESNANLTFNFQSPITNWSKLGVITTAKDGTVTSQTFDITGSKVNIGNVVAGSNIKFVLTNAKGETTMDNMKFWGSGWDTRPEHNRYEYLHFGANYGKYGSGYTSQQFQIDGTEPTGQPLPGILAALAIGGGALYVGYRRRKSRIKS